MTLISKVSLSYIYDKNLIILCVCDVIIGFCPKPEYDKISLFCYPTCIKEIYKRYTHLSLI